MQKIFGFLLILLLPALSKAQSGNSDSSFIILMNQQIDDLVVQQDTKALDDLYGNDFVFSHGSGKVQDKKAWMVTVGRTKYPLRRHDSVTAEIHPAVAVVKGKMTIQRNDKTKIANYTLKYIRVYALRDKKWQLISHSTTHEEHQ